MYGTRETSSIRLKGTCDGLFHPKCKLPEYQAYDIEEIKVDFGV
jgi:hypothetical protein